MVGLRRRIVVCLVGDFKWKLTASAFDLLGSCRASHPPRPVPLHDWSDVCMPRAHLSWIQVHHKGQGSWSPDISMTLCASSHGGSRLYCDEMETPGGQVPPPFQKYIYIYVGILF